MKFKPDYKLTDNLFSTFNDQELIILESQLGDHPASGQTLAAVHPVRSIRAAGNRIRVVEQGRIREYQMNPWEALKQFRQQGDGWLFGYLGYDLKNHTEALQSKNPSLADCPDLWFMEPETVLKFSDGGLETLKGQVLQSLIRKPLQPAPLSKNRDKVNVQSAIPKEVYVNKVKQIKEKIREGDFYELNYTYPFVGHRPQNAFDLYRSMRAVNPVPFGAFLRTGGLEVCCSSPERFLKKNGSTILSEPIKGTSARYDEKAEDEVSRKVLLNEKNRAENLMIVDLVRHDFSRVCETGSVNVDKMYDIQSFGTVHQLISTISGTIKPGMDSVDVIRHCFPMGSMTGAPKIEVMKQIDELEMYKRGIYSGSIGYFTPDDNFDFNVVIRSAIMQGSRLIYPVGGAITSDSDPLEEWEETKLKAKNLTTVLT